MCVVQIINIYKEKILIRLSERLILYANIYIHIQAGHYKIRHRYFLKKIALVKFSNEPGSTHYALGREQNVLGARNMSSYWYIYHMIFNIFR